MTDPTFSITIEGDDLPRKVIASGEVLAEVVQQAWEHLKTDEGPLSVKPTNWEELVNAVNNAFDYEVYAVFHSRAIPEWLNAMGE